ncbi:MAG TPA: phosphomannose isomerase type II C-terminal cupin domain [Candidatus Paceibacterota bacterium]
MDKINKIIEERPWGKFEQFTLNEKSTVKILTIEAGEAFSLQTHKHRTEFWHVLEGKGKITVGDGTVNAQLGDEFLIQPGINHRIEGITKIKVLEIAFGEFDEADIQRLEDKYNRA